MSRTSNIATCTICIVNNSIKNTWFKKRSGNINTVKPHLLGSISTDYVIKLDDLTQPAVNIVSA